MGLFKRMFGKEEVDPILGGLSQPSGLEARPAETPGFTPTPVPEPTPAPAPDTPEPESLNMANPFDMLKLARQFQHLEGDPTQLMAQLQQMFPTAQIDMQQQYASGSPEAAARWMEQFYAAQGIDTGGGDDDEQLDQLERLAALHQRGALSDDEFAAAKAKLLGEV